MPGVQRRTAAALIGPRKLDPTARARRARPAQRPAAQTNSASPIFEPVTPARWDDLVALFGPRGACAGCWCMWWRRARPDWTRGKGLGNRRALRALVMAGPPPGLLAYVQGQPVGWVALAPRTAYPRLVASRTLVGPDARPVWSITCVFVARTHRRLGLSVALIEAAAAYARACGATLIEAYPVDAGQGRLPDAFAFTGLRTAYVRAGFSEVARPARTRAVMRLALTTEER